jgi:hypothetical protein
MKSAKITALLTLMVVFQVAGIDSAKADEVPGFSLEGIREIGDVSLSSRLGTASGASEHVVNISDCTAYLGKQVEVTIQVDVSLGDFYYTLMVGQPDVSCSTSSLEPSTEDGCVALVTNETLSSSTTTALVELDDLTGGDCSVGTSTTSRIYLIAQYTDDTTVIYVSTTEFLVDLQAPATPILSSLSSGDLKLAVNWTDESNEGDNVTYNVYWQEGSGLTNPSTFSQTGLTAQTYDIEENVENSVTYSVGVTAVDSADNESSMSATETAAPAPSTDFWEAYQEAGGTDPGGFCFIATAAYGSPMTKDLGTLRAFRDQILMQTSMGRAFVESYYRWGRFGAAFIADKPVVRACVRALLTPIVWVTSVLVAFGPLGGIFLLMSIGLVLTALRRRMNRFILRDVPLEVRS